MRRSHTVRTTRSSLPTGPQTTDDLGTLQEVRAPASHNIELLEASLRSEIFEKERENDRLVDQVLSLQTQLAQRPPLAAIQELENEKKTLEIILLGTQRENEKMMTELERQKKRERTLETELRRLCGDNWQTDLSRDDADVDGDGDIDSGPEEHPQRRQPRRPTEREIALEHANELLKKQIEQVRLLVLGMDERLVGREDRLAKAIQRAEQENKDLEAKLRELDLNAPID
ncbi:hypothetical protein BS47DRAFT_1327902 [Hydnum rufescens UP504]|uniref:Uncharacterized protein n=1 Tax=Hydnum rufescens UP504 TaxID=1448309 RepID=A0A9P6DW34_9AGAM|nr:hypothetical protein BS47DRAFT_1327902 [Hydnum rufescens UP504]